MYVFIFFLHITTKYIVALYVVLVAAAVVVVAEVGVVVVTEPGGRRPLAAE